MAELTRRLERALSHRYRIEREIGRGGMAFVFAAVDLRHDRRVAVKVIRPDLAPHVGPERFLREVKVTAGLSHPHIRPLLDSGRADGLLYYVMPLLEGETLAGRLEREKRLSLEDALSIARDVADALHHAHNHEIVHRDVKPENIFLEGGHAILSDFGIALPVAGPGSDRITGTDVAVGTPEYMSPEQCAGAEDVDGRGDLYALGCVLYETLTGEPPFTGRTRMAVIARQVAERPTSVKILRPDVPDEVAALVERCLAKTPGDRYGSAAGLRDQLEETLTAVRSRGIGARASRAALRSLPTRLLVYLAGIALLAAGVWALLPRDLEAVDSEKVIVFPLADRGGGQEGGADAALMIGNALAHTEPLKWIDGWQSLTPEQRRDATLLSLDRAREIALDRRAASFILGGVTWRGDSVTVLLTLHDTRGDSVLAQASASGALPERTPDQVSLQAVTRFLPHLLGSKQEVDLSYLRDRDPSAVTRWLQGDRAYRQAHFSRALDLYREAVERDSLLALAALKGAQAASWTEQLPTAQDLIRLAAAHDSVLPPRYRELAGGFQAYLDGRADEAVARFRNALERNPEWSEAWTALGEVYRHLLPEDAVVGSSETTAFREAAHWDPGFVPPRIHLAERALLEGDLERARPLMESLGEDPGSYFVSAVRMAWRCATGEMSESDWLEAVGDDPRAVLNAAQLLLDGPAAQASCAEAGFQALLTQTQELGVRWGAVLGLNALFVGHGRTEDTDKLLIATRAEGISDALFLYLLDDVAGGGGLLAARAQGVDSLARSNWGPSYSKLNGPLTLWALGVWHAHRGDRSSLSAALDRLRALEREGADETVGILAQALEAQHLALSGDTAQAIERLRELESPRIRGALAYGLWEPLAVERILLARLLLATGSLAEAWEVAALLDHPQPVMFALFRPLSLSIRARASAQLRGEQWQERSRDARARLEALGREDLIRQPPP